MSLRFLLTFPVLLFVLFDSPLEFAVLFPSEELLLRTVLLDEELVLVSFVIGLGLVTFDAEEVLL